MTNVQVDLALEALGPQTPAPIDTLSERGKGDPANVYDHLEFNRVDVCFCVWYK